MDPQGWVTEPLNAWRLIPSYGMRSLLRRSNLINTHVCMKLQELSSSLRIHEMVWFVIKVVTTNGSVTLRIPCTFLLSQNHMISIYILPAYSLPPSIFKSPVSYTFCLLCPYQTIHDNSERRRGRRMVSRLMNSWWFRQLDRRSSTFFKQVLCGWYMTLESEGSDHGDTWDSECDSHRQHQCFVLEPEIVRYRMK